MKSFDVSKELMLVYGDIAENKINRIVAAARSILDEDDTTIKTFYGLNIKLADIRALYIGGELIFKVIAVIGNEGIVLNGFPTRLENEKFVKEVSGRCPHLTKIKTDMYVSKDCVEDVVVVRNDEGKFEVKIVIEDYGKLPVRTYEYANDAFNDAQSLKEKL